MTTQNTDALRAALADLDPATATNDAKVAIAKTALQCAVELLDQVAEATGDEYARSYMVDHLRALSRWRPGFQKVPARPLQMAQLAP